MFYGDIINKAKQFKYDTSELVKYLKIFIRIGYNLAVRVHSLMQDYFTKNIDWDKQAIILLFILYYVFNIWFQQIDDVFALFFHEHHQCF